VDDWLNYWSAAAARAIGFPDPARDADLLSRSRRTEMGGWVVKLTDAPLDLNNPAHLDALKRAYERFPEIGGRALIPLGWGGAGGGARVGVPAEAAGGDGASGSPYAR
jgi:hypothetical protein